MVGPIVKETISSRVIILAAVLKTIKRLTSLARDTIFRVWQK